MAPAHENETSTRGGRWAVPGHSALNIPTALQDSVPHVLGVRVSLPREQALGCKEWDLGIIFSSSLALGVGVGGWEGTGRHGLTLRLPEFSGEMRPDSPQQSAAPHHSAVVVFPLLVLFLFGASWGHFLSKQHIGKSCPGSASRNRGESYRT